MKEANGTISYIYAASIFVLSTSILCCILIEDFVKLQSKVQASVLGLGVDFVFPLSQEQQEQQQEEQQQEQPHQNIPEKSILEVLNFTHRLIP